MKIFALKFLAFLQILFITWGCSGTHAKFMFPMFVVAVLMFAIYSFCKRENRTFLEKTIICTNFVLLVVSVISYFNPFWERVNGERFISFQKLDYITWLPTSVKAEFFEGNALYSLMEISTSLLLFVVLLYLFKDRRFMRATLSFFVINVALMGIFGIWQKNESIKIMYDSFLSNSSFFGTFYLENAAGAFFNLGICVSISLAVYYALKKGLDKLFFVFFILLAVVCSYSVWYSNCITAIIIMGATWITSIFCCVIFALTKRPVLVCSCVGLLACIGLLFAIPVVYEKLMHSEQAEKNLLKTSVSMRVQMYDIAKNMIAENLVYGTGGHSCRYKLTVNMIKNTKQPISSLHAHSDILEYLIDYGLFGLFAIVFCSFAYLYQFAKSNPSCPAMILFIGVMGAIAHSCVDMNLHIMSSMVAFVYVTVASVRFSKRRRVNENHI